MTQEKTNFYAFIVIIGFTVGIILGGIGGHWYGKSQGYDRGYKTGYSTGVGLYEGNGTDSYNVMPYSFWFSWNDEEANQIVEDYWVSFEIILTWEFNPKINRPHFWTENRDFDFIGNSTYRLENGTIWYTSSSNETITDIVVTRTYAWVEDRPEDSYIEVQNIIYEIEYLNATAFTYEAEIWFEPIYEYTPTVIDSG
jgi:hypothetical protein